MTLCYAAITRGTTILVSHPQKGGLEVESVVRQLLEKIPEDKNTKTTFTSESLQFHVLVENGMTYLCVADPDFGKRVPHAFLAALLQKFHQQVSLVARVAFAQEFEFNRDFQHVLSRMMDDYSSGRGDELSYMKAQVNDVKDVMTQNIEKVVQRGEKLEDLVTKTEDLEASASQFRRQATSLQKKMRCKNMRLWIILGFVLVVIITLIVLFATGVIS